MTKKSFVKGAAILAGAGILVKILGAFFRIPLANFVGSEGMADYGVAYPIYAFLVVFATAGLPVAVSRMVSARVTVGDYRSAHKVFKRALKLLLIVGLISTVILLSFADVIANLAGRPTAALGLRMIAPALFFVAMLSSYRGYFQGLQQMVPTAATQITEQLIKLGAGLLLAYFWVQKGPQYGAAGALLGVSLSEIAALVIMLVFYNRKKGGIKTLRRETHVEPYVSKHKSILGELLFIAFPIILGASIMPLIMSLDSFLVNNILDNIDFSAYSSLNAGQNFGVLVGIANPLVNMPAVLSLALSMSLVPAISEAAANKDLSAVSTRSALGFKLAILIGLPCALGMFLLSDNIVTILYSSGFTPDELAVGGGLLRYLAIGVLFLTVLQTTTGIIQGAGKPYLPLRNLAIGAAIKVVLSILLIRQPQFNIYGAAIGTAACYTITALLNIISMTRITKPNIKPLSGIIMPVLSTAIMGVLVYFLSGFMIERYSNTVTTVVVIIAAVFVYGLALLITKSLSKQDLQNIPGGGLITKIMFKLRLWRA